MIHWMCQLHKKTTILNTHFEVFSLLWHLSLTEHLLCDFCKQRPFARLSKSSKEVVQLMKTKKVCLYQ